MALLSNGSIYVWGNAAANPYSNNSMYSPVQVNLLGLDNGSEITGTPTYLMNQTGTIVTLNAGTAGNILDGANNATVNFSLPYTSDKV